MQCCVQVVIVKKLVYTPTKSQLEAYYDNIMKQTVPESYVVSIHAHTAKRLKQFWERSEDWAISHRLDLLTRGKNTNNYAEAGMRILKEIIFG